MQQINWPVLSAALGQLALYDALLAAVATIIAAPAMKYFARHIPLLSCAVIFFVPAFVVSFIFLAAWLLLKLVGIKFPNEVSGVSTFAGMIVTGWLINRYVARNYSIPIKFPSLGFKVMLSLIVLSWVLVGVSYGLSLLSA